jgi:hypothetical protein
MMTRHTDPARPPLHASRATCGIRTRPARGHRRQPPATSKTARKSNAMLQTGTRGLVVLDIRARGALFAVFAVLRHSRIAGAPRLAIAKDAVDRNLHFPWAGLTDCARSFNPNDFNLPTTIARIVVVQNLSRYEHDACAASQRLYEATRKPAPTVEPPAGLTRTPQKQGSRQKTLMECRLLMQNEKCYGGMHLTQVTSIG